MHSSAQSMGDYCKYVNDSMTETNQPTSIRDKESKNKESLPKPVKEVPFQNNQNSNKEEQQFNIINEMSSIKNENHEITNNKRKANYTNINSNTQINQLRIGVSDEINKKTTDCTKKTLKQISIKEKKEKIVSNVNVEYLIETIIYSIIIISKFINDRAQSRYKVKLKYFNYCLLKKIINVENYKEILEKEVIDIYLDKFFKLNIKYKQINSLLKEEKYNKKEKIKLLNLLFKKKIKEINTMYLSNYPYIKYGNAELYIKGFRKFKEDYDKNNEVEIKRINILLENNPKTKGFSDNYEIQKEKGNTSGNLDSSESKKLSNKKRRRSKTKIKEEKKINDEDEKIKPNDRERRKIITSCSDSVKSFIENKYLILGITLHSLTVKGQYHYSFEDFRKFFNKYIRDIYDDFEPRRLNEECKNKEREYDYNKKAIQVGIEIEKENEEEENRILYKIFKYAKFIDFLYAYLNDKDFITVKDENDNYIIIKLDGFNTYKDCLNEYSPKQKEEYKKDMIKIANGESQGRNIKKKNEKIDEDKSK